MGETQITASRATVTPPSTSATSDLRKSEIKSGGGGGGGGVTVGASIKYGYLKIKLQI